MPLFTPPQTHPITAAPDVSLYDLAAVEASLQADASDLRYFMHSDLYSVLFIPTLCLLSMHKTIEFSCLLNIKCLCGVLLFVKFYHINDILILGWLDSFHLF